MAVARNRRTEDRKPDTRQGRETGEGRRNGKQVARKELIDLLNEDLSREYQAVIAYVVYSQVLKGAEYMTIAKELEVHATEELDHALRFYAIAEDIRHILVQEQEHQIDLATALGKDIVETSRPEETA